MRRTLALPRGRALAVALAVVVGAISLLYVLLPAVAGLERTWDRVGRAEAGWLVAAGAFEVLSFLSYVFVFRAVFGGGRTAVGWRDSYRITMAGVVATRLLAAAGAGGVLLTVWALDRLGMARREIAAREATFLVLLYAIYMSALVVFGTGLHTGVLPGPAPFGLTVVPAIFGAAVIAIALGAAFFSRDLEGAITRVNSAPGRMARWARAVATVPATLSAGVKGAVEMIRARRAGTLGAVGWWAFDIAVLAACLRAFGGDPAISIVVMAYFVGMLANTLPLPGGIGAVDGGMIGALIGFGVEGGLAIVGVLTYRLFAFWLPIVPGLIAYVQLVREQSS